MRLADLNYGHGEYEHLCVINRGDGYRVEVWRDADEGEARLYMYLDLAGIPISDAMGEPLKKFTNLTEPLVAQAILHELLTCNPQG